MDALLVLLAELLWLPLIGVAVVGVELLAALIAALAGAVSWVTRRRRSRGPGAAVEAPVLPRWRRRVRAALVGVLALTALGIALMQTVLFAPTVRLMLGRIEARTGIRVEFETASGSVLAGRVELRGARIVRQRHPTSTFDLRVARLDVDVALLDLVGTDRMRFDAVALAGVRGRYDQLAEPDPLRRRRFEITELTLRDAELTLRDHTRRHGPLEVAVAVDSWEASPLRSRFAPFDMLFHSNAELRLAGEPLRLETRDAAGGRETRWRARALPVPLVAAYLGGPFHWLSGGEVELDVHHRWRGVGAGSREVDTDWRFELRDLRGRVPDDASRATRIVAAPVVQYLNSRAARSPALPLRLQLTIDPRRFDGRSSLEAAGLWELVATNAARALARKAGVSTRSLGEWGRKGLGAVRGYLDRRRGTSGAKK